MQQSAPIDDRVFPMTVDIATLKVAQDFSPSHSEMFTQAVELVWVNSARKGLQNCLFAHPVVHQDTELASYQEKVLAMEQETKDYIEKVKTYRQMPDRLRDVLTEERVKLEKELQQCLDKKQEIIDFHKKNIPEVDIESSPPPGHGESELISDVNESHIVAQENRQALEENIAKNCQEFVSLLNKFNITLPDQRQRAERVKEAIRTEPFRKEHDPLSQLFDGELTTNSPVEQPQSTRARVAATIKRRK